MNDQGDHWRRAVCSDHRGIFPGKGENILRFCSGLLIFINASGGSFNQRYPERQR